MENFVITPHRAKILSVLLKGDIEDPSGKATPMLKEHTGHRETNSLSGVLAQMEEAGLVVREMNGRRTYRIALTKKGRRLAEQLNAKTPVTDLLDRASSPATETAEAIVNGSVDLDLLAGVLLKKALLATQAQEESASGKTSAAALAKAEQRVAELEQELRAAKMQLAEQKALIATLEHNNKVLAGQMDKVRNSPGQPIKELISRKELLELDKLMRQLPAAKG